MTRNPRSTSIIFLQICDDKPARAQKFQIPLRREKDKTNSSPYKNDKTHRFGKIRTGASMGEVHLNCGLPVF
jgi:hypothetical protein